MSRTAFGIRNHNVDPENPVPGKASRSLISTPRRAFSEIKNLASTPNAVRGKQNLFAKAKPLKPIMNNTIIFEDAEYLPSKPSKIDSKALHENNSMVTLSENTEQRDGNVDNKSSLCEIQDTQLTDIISQIPFDNVERFNIGLEDDIELPSPVKFVQLEERQVSSYPVIEKEKGDNFDYTSPVESFGPIPEEIIDLRDFTTPDIVLMETGSTIYNDCNEQYDFDFFDDPELSLENYSMKQIDAFVACTNLAGLVV